MIPDPHFPPADLDVVITSYRTPVLLERCLRSWRDHDPARRGITVNLIVVDVDPEPGRPNFMPGPEATVLRTATNVGYGGACNRAARLCNAPVISFWNADTALIDDEAIPTMLRFFEENPTAGIAGPLSIDEDGNVTHAGILGTYAQPAHRHFKTPLAQVDAEVRDVRRAITVSGSAYFMRRTAFDKLADCSLYRETIAPLALGAFLDTPHYFEETWVSYHAFAHREQVWYVGTAMVEHLWERAPAPPEANTRDLFAMSQPIFRRACEIHGIEHD